jgi:hypothetical protein
LFDDFPHGISDYRDDLETVEIPISSVLDKRAKFILRPGHERGAPAHFGASGAKQHVFDV